MNKVLASVAVLLLWAILARAATVTVTIHVINVSTQQPIQGANVGVWNLTNQVASGYTDADGNLTFQCSDLNSYVVAVVKPGFYYESDTFNSPTNGQVVEVSLLSIPPEGCGP